MNKTLIVLILTTVLFNSAMGQINSDAEASDTLRWLIENPQVKSDSIFTERAVEVLKWQATNHPKSEMRVRGISEFMNTSRNDQFFNEIVMIYTLSEFDNQINNNVREDESAFIALNNVLEYYKNVIAVLPDYSNTILDKYLRMFADKLRRKIKSF